MPKLALTPTSMSSSEMLLVRSSWANRSARFLAPSSCVSLESGINEKDPRIDFSVGPFVCRSNDHDVAHLLDYRFEKATDISGVQTFRRPHSVADGRRPASFDLGIRSSTTQSLPGV